jgi:acyl-[acyl-carrier-protein]-phospholipid O-acyltransferase/long-chain-fatty-acid--[acyl-carrier-protein] ligase
MNAQATSAPRGWRRGFWWLMATQFQNAFSDNALKNLIVLLVLADLARAAQETYVALTGALFAAPFLVFSMFGGWLADRFSKARVMRGVKLAEIAIMLFASLALGLRNLPMELASIFLMGTHSAIFGPSKYGILPEILPFERLSWGNGLLELLTFLGIILGTTAGGFLAEYLGASQYFSGLMLTALAIAGFFMSRGITRVPAANPGCPPRLNPITDLRTQLRLLRRDRDLWRANWGNTGFWFVAALIQMNLLIYAKEILHLSESKNGLLSTALSIGIGVGSAAAGLLSRGRIQYGLVPLGAAGLALSTVPMGFDGLPTAWFCVWLVTLGLGAGFFIVPIAAVLQHRPPPESKGAVQGAANLLSFAGVFAASAAQMFLGRVCHLSPGKVFWVCGALALATGLYAVATRREALRELFARSAPTPATTSS